MNREPDNLSSHKIFSISHASSYRDAVFRHLPAAVISGCILAVAYWLPVDQIPFRICFFLRLTGYPCMTCGWTRGFVSMAHGNWLEVLYDCPLAIGLYLLTVLVFAWNMTGIILGVKINRGKALQFNWKKTVSGVVFAFFLVLMNWGYRLAMGLK